MANSEKSLTTLSEILVVLLSLRLKKTQCFIEIFTCLACQDRSFCFKKNL